MGIKGLYTYLREYRGIVHPLKAAPMRIGVDALSLLYKYKGDTKELLSLLQGMVAVGHKVLFVFDGKAPPEKGAEIQERKESKEGAQSKATMIQEFLNTEEAGGLDATARRFFERSLERCEQQSWHVTRQTRRAFQDDLWNISVPYVKSVSEADDVLVDLYKGGKLDAILSSDMDYLAAGVERLWIPTIKGVFEEVLLSAVLEGERLEIAGFVDACIISRISSATCVNAFTWMRHYKTIQGILGSSISDMNIRSRLADVELLEKERGRFKCQAPYSRIRPDHLERVQEFLDAL